MCRYADFNSVEARFPYCFSKRAMKQDFLDIYQATFSVSVISKIQSLWGSSFCSTYLKFNLDFKNAAKKYEKIFFFFWDNCIWIGRVNLSLLRRRYLSSAANVLASSPRFYMSIRQTFCNAIDLAVITDYNNGAVMQISTVFGYVYYLACRRVLSNWTF